MALKACWGSALGSEVTGEPREVLEQGSPISNAILALLQSAEREEATQFQQDRREMRLQQGNAGGTSKKAVYVRDASK